MTSALDSCLADCVRAVATLEEEPIRVLLVDDQPDALQTSARALERAGYSVTTASDGERALELFREANFDLVVSDLDMPRLDGAGLLQAIRAADPELPLIVVTGCAELESATAALGVVRHLTKPFRPQQLVQTACRAAAARRLSQMRRSVAEAAARDARELEASRQRLGSAFDQLYMAFQPIVHLPTLTVFGHEALVRSRDASIPNAGALLELSERLGEVWRMGRRIREACATALPAAPNATLLFVNLHASELLDPQLLEAAAPLSKVAGRVILEIAERANLPDLEAARRRIAELRALGFRIAIDDIGAGYAGLNSFALLEPEVVKMDMTLVRNVEGSLVKRRLIASFLQLCKSLDIAVIAEGVETRAELDALVNLGCELFQGHLFARPEARFWTSI